jgi:hypothetical protein
MIIIWILMHVACSYGIEAVQKDSLPFFDLAGYIKTTISDSISYNVEKSITINGSIESKQIERYAIWKDVKDFDTYDINRPALFDKYQVDTIQEGPIRHIVHLPIDEDLKVRLLKISLADDGQIIGIEINAATKSFLEDVALQITWQPGHGYVINRKSERLFKPEPSLQVVEVRIR